MSDIPEETALDSSLAFLREGYTFVSSRCDRLRSDLFRTKLMLTPVVCMRGAEATGLFYGGGRFTRMGAMPTSVLHLLQDEGSVQSLDGTAHRQRKAMFMAMMTPAAIRSIAAIYREEWQEAVARWQEERVVLHDELTLVLTRTGARFAGVPLTHE